VAVWGPSGSGKTSLLNIMGLIDAPTFGHLSVAGQEVDGLAEAALAEIRNRRIGFVFQNFNLLPVLGALENVMLPLQIRGVNEKEARRRAAARLERVGLGGLMDRRPDKMSGGQRQRVAIARALICEPSLVLADEPTANLDSETALRIIGLMRELCERESVTFVFATHDTRLLDSVDRRVRLEDGRVADQGGR
jgi:putative ABC transport system ATP-binding protein